MQAKSDEVVITITWVHIAVAAIIIVASFALWNFLAPMLGPGVRLSTNKREYKPGEEVVLEGWVNEGFLTPSSSIPVAIEVRGPLGVVWIDQTTTDGSGYFVSAFTLREDSTAGEYEAFASTELARSSTTFRVRP